MELAKIEQLNNEAVPQMTAADAHYLMKLVEVQAIAFITELFLRASLMRTETRAGHYREDYPHRDNENWLKWIVASQRDGKINLRTEPVPFDKYEFKPTRYYMDNFEIRG
jgi:succinate dehydrogenase / fumarate reductase flavoprotein subunit